MNCEKKVAAKLDKMGTANYVPVQQEEHQWSDRKKKIDRVRLVKGPMKGLEGELSYIEENKPIVAIRIDGLGYACVSVEKINLELI